MICHKTKILHGYWLNSPHCSSHTHDSFILQLEVVPLNVSNLFFPPSNPFLLETTCLFSVSRTVSVLLCLLIFFKIPISEIMQSFFSCDLMTTFSVMFGFLSLFLIISSFLLYLFFIICFSFSFLVCVYYRFLICGYNEFYM